MVYEARFGIEGGVVRHYNKMVYGIQTKTNSIKIFGIRQNEWKFQMRSLLLSKGVNELSLRPSRNAFIILLS